MIQCSGRRRVDLEWVDGSSSTESEWSGWGSEDGSGGAMQRRLNGFLTGWMRAGTNHMARAMRRRDATSQAHSITSSMMTDARVDMSEWMGD